MSDLVARSLFCLRSFFLRNKKKKSPSKPPPKSSIRRCRIAPNRNQWNAFLFLFSFDNWSLFFFCFSSFSSSSIPFSARHNKTYQIKNKKKRIRSVWGGGGGKKKGRKKMVALCRPVSFIISDLFVIFSNRMRERERERALTKLRDEKRNLTRRRRRTRRRRTQPPVLFFFSFIFSSLLKREWAGEGGGALRHRQLTPKKQKKNNPNEKGRIKNGGPTQSGDRPRILLIERRGNK